MRLSIHRKRETDTRRTERMAWNQRNILKLVRLDHLMLSRGTRNPFASNSRTSYIWRCFPNISFPNGFGSSRYSDTSTAIFLSEAGSDSTAALAPLAPAADVGTTSAASAIGVNGGGCPMASEAPLKHLLSMQQKRVVLVLATWLCGYTLPRCLSETTTAATEKVAAAASHYCTSCSGGTTCIAPSQMKAIDIDSASSFHTAPSMRRPCEERC